MYVNFEKNRLKINDFRSWFFMNPPYHNDSIQNSEYFHMTLTFDLYLTLTLRLTFDFDDLKKLTFFNFLIYFEVTWRKNVTSYVKVNDKVNLVVMCQMRSVQWVEYYLGYNITTITTHTWPSLLTFDLDFFPWPWPWYLTLRLIYYYIDALKK